MKVMAIAVQVELLGKPCEVTFKEKQGISIGGPDLTHEDVQELIRRCAVAVPKVPEEPS